MAASREIIDKYKSKILNRENVVGIAYGRRKPAERQEKP